MPRRRKYESRKGFTLVEMIVVLLILAVVTSMAVPAFSRQIDDAKEKKAVTEAQACVTAGTGLGAQLYSEARSTALQSVSTDANASDAVTAALTGWASSVTDKGPTLTGGLALTEGQGQYYLKPGNLQSGTAAGAAELKAAASVDGTVEDFWCSGTGQIVYLRYLSADGILVAYTNNGTSGSNITIPTPDVPEPDPNKPDQPTDNPTQPTDKPTESPDPAPDEPDMPVINGPKVVIHVEDGATKGKLVNWTFKMYPQSDPSQWFIVKTDSNGDIIVGLNENKAPFTPYYMNEWYSYVLEDITVPEGYQAMDNTLFSASAVHRQQDPWDIIDLAGITINNYLNGEYLTGSGNTSVMHLPRYQVPYLHFRKVDANGTRLSGATFTLKQGDITLAEFTSNDSKDYDYSIPVKRNAKDGIYSNTFIDLTNGITTRSYTLVEKSAPSQYNSVGEQTFNVSYRYNVSGVDAFDVELPWTNWVSGYSLEDDSMVFHHVITITDTPINEAAVEPTCTVTINKKVYTYADADPEKPSGTDFLPSDKKAVLKLTGHHVSETWATRGNSKALKLRPGTYKLEELTSPNGYLLATPITFTVKESDKELTIDMLDTTTRDEKVVITIPGKDSTFTLNATNWAHKLTTDDAISFSSELLTMNGVLYYAYSGKDVGGSNPNMTQYAEYFNRYGTLPDDAPNPIEFLDNNSDVTGNEHIVQLTGTIHEWQENATISLTKGDIVILNNKAYVYIADKGSILKLDSNFKRNLKSNGFSKDPIGDKKFSIK